jgi:glucose/arabinose dehydrogenase
VTAAPGDDSRLFVLEQPGRIQILEGGETTGTFLDIQGEVYQEQFNNDERGLLGLAFHPDYQNNGLFYVHYSASGSGDTQISEFSVSSDPNVADPASERTVISEEQLAFNHNGGMLAFGPDGFLHIGLGDGGDSNDTQNNAQNLSTIKGSLLRIDVDGRDAGAYGIPAGNMTGTDVAPEILDYGLRNPWRFSFDPCTGDIYIGDVGQNEYEEIDVRPADADNVNWGWSVKEGMGCCQACDLGGNSCDETGLTDPILEYGRGDGTSVTGGYVYRSSEIPGLRGYYFYGDFGSQVIWMFRYDNGEAADHQEVSLPGSGGITSFGQDNSGNVYIVRYTGTLQKIIAE